MCGLVGVISKSTNGFIQKERDVFDQLLFIDTLRGDDSTGMMLVDYDGNIDIAKEGTDAQDFQRSDEYKRLMTKSFRDGAAIIGHNRKATRGVINDENAHPFIVDDRIILVHNGTLWGDHKKIADVEVDSHAIAHLIHKHEDDVEAALRDIEGAYALIWYDVQKRTMNFIRNAQRPLFYIETDSSWMWASEAGMLSWVLSRNQVTAPKTNKIQELEVGTLHSFARSGRLWTKTEKKLDLAKRHVSSSYNHYTEADACAWSGDNVLHRRGMGSVWHGDDNWENDDVIIPGLETKSLVPVREPVRSASAQPSGPLSAVQTLDRFTIKVLPGESSRALKRGCVMTAQEFGKLASEWNSAGWISGNVFDYDYVRGVDCTQGVFLYATMQAEPRAMIRCYVPFDNSKSQVEYENEILNLDGKKCAFNISYKGWHKHDVGDVNEGFSVFYAKDHSPIIVRNSTTKQEDKVQ